MKNMRFGDDKLPLVAPSPGVTGGSPVLVGALFAVPSTTQATGETFDGFLEGTFELVKKSGVAPTAGAKAYWDNSTKSVTTAATTGFYLIGVFAKDYLTGDLLAEVRLDGVSVTALP